MEQAKLRAEWKEYCDNAIDCITEAPTPVDKVLIMRSIYCAASPTAVSILSGKKHWVKLFLELKPTIEKLKEQ